MPRRLDGDVVHTSTEARSPRPEAAPSVPQGYARLPSPAAFPDIRKYLPTPSAASITSVQLEYVPSEESNLMKAMEKAALLDDL